MRGHRWIAALATVVMLSAGSVAVDATNHAHSAVCADGRPGRLVGKDLLCVHGDEPPPPGVDTRRRPNLDELRGRRLGNHSKPPKADGSVNPAFEEDPDAPAVAGTEAGAGSQYQIKCIGDGITGNRVQAVYAVATDQTNRSRDVVPLIRQYAADGDLRINRSASVHGEGRRVRYVTAPMPDGQCQIDVRVVFLSPTGDDTFSNMRRELAAEGLNRTDRKYLVWVDTAVGICGLGELYNSDRPTADNPNNRGPMYARVDAPCWGYAEMHELLHTLGAVQGTAPHATAAGHCFQKNDTMCYADSSGVTITQACPDLPVQWVDCGLDDYFSVRPGAQSYLASKWNVANSSFLQPDTAPPPPPKVVVSAPDRMFAGNTVTVRADITVPQGLSSVINWSASRGDCRFGTPAQATSTFYCPATAAGDVQVTAAVVDSDGMAAANVATVKLAVPTAPRDTILTATLSKASVVYGGETRMTGRLTDAATGAGVGGMPVTLYSLADGTTDYRTKNSGLTDRNGNITLSVRPALSANLLMIAGSTGTWQQAHSPRRHVTVKYSVKTPVTTTTVETGDSLTISATALPAVEGTKVLLRRPTSTGFITIATTTLTSTGTAKLRVTPTRDLSDLRIVVPATSQHGAGRSSTVDIEVR